MFLLYYLRSTANAACFNRGMTFVSLCPWDKSHSMNFTWISWNVSGSFWLQFLESSPLIKPLKQLCGCADRGGM
jgi:hypothetical protein